MPINRMVPRSFVTSIAAGASLPAGKPTELRGIAFGGDSGVSAVDVSIDAGTSWQPAQLGADQGQYGFRAWNAEFTPSSPGRYAVAVRCTNTKGEVQPDAPNWNPAGFMRNVIEATEITAV